jgi:hypothetical protein
MYSPTPSLTSTLVGGGWSTPRRDRITPGKDLVPIEQEAEWAPGPVWAGAGKLAPQRIRSRYLPARNKSLYRLRYPGAHY